MTGETISGEAVAKLAETDPDCRDLLQVQFELSTDVRYEIRVRIRAYWPDKERNKVEQHFQKVHEKRIEGFEKWTVRAIKNDLQERDTKLILELNELLEKHSKVPVSVIVEKTGRLKDG